MSNNKNNSTSKRHGIDALLMAKGKTLRVGQEIRFTLVKGSDPSSSEDPINSKAAPETFPVVAKFSESVVKPDFTKFKRLYQQDIPSQKDDSDEEAERASQPARKKRRYRRNEGPRRQWVLQTEEDYLESMIAQREQGKHYKQDTNIVSSRYEGLPEHNPSHYILIGADDEEGSLQVTTLPTPYAVHNFSQPAKIQTMSMSQAEQAIEDQRKNTTRYMMHKNQPVSTITKSSKDRLFDKLKKLSSKGAEDDDDDDIMGDVKFQNRKGGGGRARKELLSSMADGVAMDADGVIGGANDAEFGGKRRFMNVNLENSGTTTKGDAAQPSQSNDGMAMADDFYQRDVKAEYEELDYDANEQFDDDDVDLGEGEMVMDGGFAEDLDEDDEADDDDDEDEDDEKKAGLASIKGLKDMLAKARGEAPVDGKEGEKKEEDEGGRPSSPATPAGQEDDKLAQVMAAAERKTREAAEQKAAAAAAAAAAQQNVEQKKGPSGVQLDEFGQRVLTLEGVRYEIFLNNKSIAMKKLMKLYNIKKKSEKNRIQTFQAIIKELCTMEKDPVQGNILKLKQHYQKGI